MHRFIHKSTYLQPNCEGVAYADGNVIHLFRDQSMFAVASEHKGR